MFAAALALLTFTSAPVPKNLPKAPTPEGEWQLVATVYSGMPGQPENIGAPVTIKDGQLSIVTARRTTTWALKFGTRTTPTTIDLQGDGLSLSAIYKFEADKLTICYGFGNDRPTKFEAPTDSKFGLMILERVKK